MRVKFIILCSLWILGFPISQQAQVSLQDSSIRLGVFRIGYALTIPGQEWSNRFGTSHSINLEGGIQFSNRLVLSLEGGYLFGGNITEEGILSSIRTPSGLLINNNGTLSDVNIRLDGFHASLMAGVVLPVIPTHTPNSGIFIQAGPSFLQHKLGFNIQGDPVAALAGDSKRGFDRLTTGWGLKGRMGYQFYDKQGFVNISLGISYAIYQSSPQRGINYDTGEITGEKVNDSALGLFLSWNLLFYKRAPNKVYYY